MRHWSRLAAAGALVAALGLSACGRKGPLDPPPVASAAPAQTADGGPAVGAPLPAAPEISTGFPGMSLDASQQPSLGRDGSQPTAPPPSGQRQRFFLDWLVD